MDMSSLALIYKCGTSETMNMDTLACTGDITCSRLCSSNQEAEPWYQVPVHMAELCSVIAELIEVLSKINWEEELIPLLNLTTRWYHYG